MPESMGHSNLNKIVLHKYGYMRAEALRGSKLSILGCIGIQSIPRMRNWLNCETHI